MTEVNVERYWQILLDDVSAIQNTWTSKPWFITGFLLMRKLILTEFWLLINWHTGGNHVMSFQGQGEEIKQHGIALRILTRPVLM